MAQFASMGEFVAPAVGLASTLYTSGVSDGVDINGVTYNRLTLANIARSCLVLVQQALAITTAKTMVTKIRLQDAAASGGPWADFGNAQAGSLYATTGKTIARTGATQNDVTQVWWDITGARQYLRCVITPTLNNGATDTSTITAILLFGGVQELPATA